MQKDNCIFCKIAAGKLPADIVYRDEEILAFKDINPRAPFHLLVIPVSHYEQAPEFLNTDSPAMIGKMFMTAKKVAREQGLLAGGYRLAMNLGKGAGQAVDHYHLHLLGGKNLGPEG